MHTINIIIHFQNKFKNFLCPQILSYFVISLIPHFIFFVSVFLSLINYLSVPTTLSVCSVIAGELVHAQAAPRREAAILGRGECVALPTALQRIRGWSAREDVRGHCAGQHPLQQTLRRKLPMDRRHTCFHDVNGNTLFHISHFTAS